MTAKTSHFSVDNSGNWSCSMGFFSQLPSSSRWNAAISSFLAFLKENLKFFSKSCKLLFNWTKLAVAFGAFPQAPTLTQVSPGNQLQLPSLLRSPSRWDGFRCPATGRRRARTAGTCSASLISSICCKLFCRWSCWLSQLCLESWKMNENIESAAAYVPLAFDTTQFTE